jgi:hypothetical protein
MREPFKDIEVEDRKYRLKKMRASDGTWLMFQVGLPMMENVSDKAEASIVLELSRILRSMKREDYDSIVSLCLDNVQRFDEKTGAAFSLRAPNGKMGDAALEDDVKILFGVVLQSVLFNLSPFFSADSVLSETFQP